MNTKRPLIIAIDFDGTIVEHQFPGIGHPKPGAIEALKYLKSIGCRLILWTCRREQYLEEAKNFLLSYGITMDAYNENVPETSDLGFSVKVFANIYIDDRNIGGFIGWDKCLDEINKEMMGAKYDL